MAYTFGKEMKKKFKWIVAFFVMILLLPVAGLYLIMADEGYPTLAGVRNLFDRDGQIRIELPTGYTISDVQFDGYERPNSTAVTGNTAVIKVGYTSAMINFSFTTADRKGRIQFGEVRKLNNWNRLIFYGESDTNGRLSFQVEENGVTRDPVSYAIKQTTESGPRE